MGRGIRIATAIGKHKSTVSREIKWNCCQRSRHYRSDLAQRKCGQRLRGKPKKIRFTHAVRQYVEELLALKYSPEQIVGTAKEGRPCVPCERIYQWTWADKKQGGQAYQHLRTKGKKYRKRGTMRDKRGIIANRIGIEARPEIVEQRERLGDLEIDTIIGKNADELAAAAIAVLMSLKHLLHTITADNEKEFAAHEKIAKSLNVDFYFARPYHSWERGSNENLNGLIR